MDSQGDTNTHGSQNIATMPGVKSSSVVQVNGSSTVNSNECGTAGLEDSLAAVQLSYGSGHQSTDTGVDLNASLVGNCMGASGIVDQTNHGMEFGFGFPNSWVSPPMSGMHHGSSGYGSKADFPFTIPCYWLTMTSNLSHLTGISFIKLPC